MMLGRYVRPLVARNPAELHRAASPLELFTDLCFVVAVSQAAASLHHQIAEGHVTHGVTGFAMAFFAIFWAWLNFTWFGSAYDNDDVLYRMLTILQIVGSLVLAAGIPKMFDGSFILGVSGYIIMRIALVTQWLRAAHDDPPRRKTALRYAAGVVAVQLCWIGFLLVPRDAQVAVFVVFVVCELLVPVWAESAATTTWHPHHVAERYGLFFIIVLGESILSTTIAIQQSIDAGEAGSGLARVISGGILIVFSLWWLYFSRDDADILLGRSNLVNMTWGFGHYLVFAATAAVGAGLATRVEFYTHHLQMSARASALCVTIPVAIIVVALYAIRLRQHDQTLRTEVTVGVAVALILLGSVTPIPELVAGLACAALVIACAVQPRGAAQA